MKSSHFSILHFVLPSLLVFLSGLLLLVPQSGRAEHKKIHNQSSDIQPSNPQSPGFSSPLPLPTEVLHAVAASEAKFILKGKLFGFYSTQSCVYKTESLLIIRNYCNTSSSYPAKSFYVISPDIGHYYFYEERNSNFIKQEITLLSTPDLVRWLWPKLGTKLENVTLTNLNEVLETLYYSYDEACWMTGYNHPDIEAHGGCLIESPEFYPEWQNDSSTIVTGTQHWSDAIKTLTKGARP